MCHLVFGAALGGLLILFSQILEAGADLSVNYYLLTMFFGSAASVIYKLSLRL